MASTRNKNRHHLSLQPLPSGGIEQSRWDGPASRDAVHRVEHASQAASVDIHSQGPQDTLWSNWKYGQVTEHTIINILPPKSSASVSAEFHCQALAEHNIGS